MTNYRSSGMKRFDAWFATVLAGLFYLSLPILLIAPLWVQYVTPRNAVPITEVPKNAVPKLPASPPAPKAAVRPKPPDAAQLARGKQAYTLNCAACHQAQGEGLPGLAPGIRNADFLALASDTFIRQTIQQGRLGTAMAPRPDLSAAVVGDIISWLRDGIGTPAADRRADVSLKVAGNAREGGVKYGRYCAACHGLRGEGYLAGVPGPGIGLKGFLDAACDDFILQTVRHGRRGTPMRAFMGARGVANLTEQDVHDIIAWLRADKAP